MAKIIDYSIIIPQNPVMNQRRAAMFLRKMIKLVCGKSLPILTDDTPATPYELVVGKTNRETADGLTFTREYSRAKEYKITTVGARVYLTGLGTKPDPEPPYNTAYRCYEDGEVASVYAAYRFAEDVLGIHFTETAFYGFEEKPELEMPADFQVDYTHEALAAQLPAPIDGAAMYTMPSSTDVAENHHCLIYKTAAGKLILVDGGRKQDAEHVVRCLESLAGGKKPVISALLMTNLHRNWSGFYRALTQNPELAARVTVENLYCHLLEEEFYTKNAKRAEEAYAEKRNNVLDCENLIGAKLHVVEVGDKIDVDEFSFEVLYTPNGETFDNRNVNDSCVIYKLNYNNEQTMLLLGGSEHFTCKGMMEACPEKLKSDIVQVQQWGRTTMTVSDDCYAAINPTFTLWQISQTFWYSDNGEGINSNRRGVYRTRIYLNDLGCHPNNRYRNSNGLLSMALPLIEK